MARLDYQDNAGKTVASLVQECNAAHVHELRAALSMPPVAVDPLTLVTPPRDVAPPLSMPPAPATRRFCIGCKGEIADGKRYCYACGTRSLPDSLGIVVQPPESPIEAEQITEEKVLSGNVTEVTYVHSD